MFFVKTILTSILSFVKTRFMELVFTKDKIGVDWQFAAAILKISSHGSCPYQRQDSKKYISSNLVFPKDKIKPFSFLFFFAKH